MGHFSKQTWDPRHSLWSSRARRRGWMSTAVTDAGVVSFFCTDGAALLEWWMCGWHVVCIMDKGLCNVCTELVWDFHNVLFKWLAPETLCSAAALQRHDKKESHEKLLETKILFFHQVCVFCWSDSAGCSAVLIQRHLSLCFVLYQKVNSVACEHVYVFAFCDESNWKMKSSRPLFPRECEQEHGYLSWSP